MLVKLYKPLLWRALKVIDLSPVLLVDHEHKVANPVVRSNALTMLADAFPLQDATHTRQQSDEYESKPHW